MINFVKKNIYRKSFQKNLRFFKLVRGLLLIILGIVIVLPCFSQNTLKGKVQDENEEAVGFCHIYNRTLGLGKVGDMHGRFELTVRKGDTLEFSYVGYQSLKLVVEPVHIANFVRITLPEDSVLLPSITIYADPRYKVPLNIQGQPIFIEGVSIEGELKPIRPGTIGFGVNPGVGGMPMGGATIYGPISYFSKDEREKRKAEEAVQETRETITYQKYIAQDSVRNKLCAIYELDSNQYDQVIRRLHRQFPGIQKAYRPQEIWIWLLTHFDRTVPVIKQY